MIADDGRVEEYKWKKIKRSELSKRGEILKERKRQKSSFLRNWRRFVSRWPN
jgi:hypothetical protein